MTVLSATGRPGTKPLVVLRHRNPLIQRAGVSAGIDSGCCRSGLCGERDRRPFNDAAGILALGDLGRAVCRDVTFCHN